jgi:polyhydroxyalkanoate synthesis regulator phasin
MAVQDIFKGNIAVLGIGIAAALLIPIALPVVARAAKPLVKAMVKSGIIVFEKGREAVAELCEVMEDVVAEAKAEIEQEHAAQAMVPAAAAATATKPGAETTS